MAGLDRQKRWPDAIIAYRKAIELTPTRLFRAASDLHLRLGNALMGQGSTAEAIAAASKEAAPAAKPKAAGAKAKDAEPKEAGAKKPAGEAKPKAAAPKKEKG